MEMDLRTVAVLPVESVGQGFIAKKTVISENVVIKNTLLFKLSVR